jgi:tetratricopeptide (TPR) repeat protein
LKKQLIVAAVGIIIVTLLFIFGRTVEPKKPGVITASAPGTYNINAVIDSAKAGLNASQALYVSKLENGISRGDVPAQQLASYQSLARFWKDSVNVFEPYAFYTIEAAKLENSEKNLTFAARLMLDNLRHEENEAALNWKTTQAIELFERALKLNPENEDLKIGIGSAYVYGKGRAGNPEATMKGIQQLLSVVRKDSNNMKAHLVLGVGGLISGQYDKALERFIRIVKKEPTNLEAIAYLADTYAAKGDKEEAIKWYNISKQLVNDPAYSKEVDNRIKQLR